MLRYFLNDQPVEGPLRMDGLTLRKEMNRRYWGFLYRKLGYVDGVGGLRFEEPDAVALLRNTLKRSGLRGDTTFRIEQNGETLYDGFIDYATYQSDDDGVSVGLRDDRAVSDLSAQAATLFSIESTDVVSLHARRLGGLPGLIADPSALVVENSQPSPVPINHSVPLTRRVEKDETVAGTLTAVIVPLVQDRLYYNSTGRDQVVTLRGTVSAMAKASAPVWAELRAAVVGNEPAGVSIGSFQINAVPSAVLAVVDVAIPVPAGESLKLYWKGSVNVSSFRFAYDVRTAITVGDEQAVAASTGYGQTLFSVMRELVFRASGGDLHFQSSFLGSDPDGALLLANGAGIRGVQRPFSVSLGQVFDLLSGIFCLSMWVENGVLRLERRSKRTRRTSVISVVLNRVEVVAVDMLYNSVKAGYTTWQADDSALSADEPNGMRSYSTGLSSLRSELNLSSDVIAASGLIEQQRRKQFDEKTASSTQTNNIDDKLFLIALSGNGGALQAERLERTSDISGVYDPDTLYNIRLTPGRAIMRWADWLYPSAPLRAEQVGGSDGMVSTYANISVTERNPLPGVPTRTPMLVTLTVPMSMSDYADLGDDVAYSYHGKTITGELLSATWNLTKTGETATLQLLER